MTEKKINEQELGNITGGNDGGAGAWIYATVYGVVHYDASSCLTLRNAPGGDVMYTEAGRPMGWQNGELAYICPSTRTGHWVQANWNGVSGWTDANYLSY